MKVCKNERAAIVPIWVRGAFIILALSALIYVVAMSSQTFADFINSTVSVFVRAVMSYVTYLMPFSVFEMLVICILPAIIILVFVIVKKCNTWHKRLRVLFSLLGVISVILSMYVFMLGVGYRTTPLARKLGLTSRTDLSRDEIYRTVITVQDEINTLARELEIARDSTEMPYDVDELSRRIVKAYDKVNEEYSLVTNFTSRAKPVYYSTVMSDMRITGIYSFFTGEANVNVEYPDYVIPFSVAHELAHQRGICRENEANFTAFLVCISSDDAYIRYSGYLNLYEYLVSALYRADRDVYYEVSKTLSPIAWQDIQASNAVYNAHEDSFLGELNDKINDYYLKLNGTQGTVTYGYVVRLAVSYYEEKVN